HEFVTISSWPHACEKTKGKGFDRAGIEDKKPTLAGSGDFCGPHVKGRSNAPGAQTKESKASQRENPHGLHQTIYMQRTRANLSNGHKGTKARTTFCCICNKRLS